MFAKIILCATSNKLTAGTWRLGKLQSFQVFQNDDQGHSDFSLFLQKNVKTSLYFLVDAVEEDYRLETLPHTMGNARRELVERKLNQIYRSSVYRAAHYINREKTKRKDDRFLFVSLNAIDFIQGWMRCIEDRQAPLVGVFMLPMVGEAIVRRNKLMAPHILLSERLSSGLRQTYLHNGRLRISRLAPITEGMEKRLGFFYVSETEKTRLYLISQRFITRDTALSVVLPALDDSSQQICRSIEQEHGMECSRVDLVKFARGLGLDAKLLQTNPELLHMQLLAMGHQPDNLAPSSFIKHHQLNSLRRAINFTSLTVMLAGLVIAGVDFKQGLDQAALVQQAAIDTHRQEQLYNDVAKNFPSTPIPSNDLKIAVELKQAIANYASTPQRLMQVLSKAIEPAPQIQINRLRWVLTNDTNLKDDDKISVAAPLPAQSANAQAQRGAAPDTASLHEVGFVNGELKGFTGDYRAALDSINHLVERLRADKAVEEVTVLQEPVNVSSFSNLKGSTNDERTDSRLAALFKLKLVLKREVKPA